MLRVALVATVSVVLLTGCGGDSGAAADSQPTADLQPTASRIWDESEVMRLAGIESSDSGLSYRLKAYPECTAAVVMVTRAQVNMYVTAGDTVAANHEGTAGVKVTASEAATCVRRFTEALQAVK